MALTPVASRGVVFARHLVYILVFIMSRLHVPIEVPVLSLSERARWTLHALDAHGLDPGGCGRFRQLSRAVLDGSDEVISATEARFPRVLQAMKDLRELYFIWHVLQPSPADRQLWRRLKLVMSKGAVLLSRETRACAARDAQFELFCRAMLTRAGLSPIATAAHADFVCCLSGEHLAVECKRVTSLDAIEREVAKAASQIAALAIPGIVMVDYSDAVNPTDHVLRHFPGEQKLHAAFEMRANQFWKDFGNRVRSATKGSRVVCTTFFDHLIIHEGLESDRPTVGRWSYQTIRDSFVLETRWIRDKSLGTTANELIQTLGLPDPVSRPPSRDLLGL